MESQEAEIKILSIGKNIQASQKFGIIQILFFMFIWSEI